MLSWLMAAKHRVKKIKMLILLSLRSDSSISSFSQFAHCGSFLLNHGSHDLGTQSTHGRRTPTGHRDRIWLSNQFCSLMSLCTCTLRSRGIPELQRSIRASLAYVPVELNMIFQLFQQILASHYRMK